MNDFDLAGAVVPRHLAVRPSLGLGRPVSSGYISDRMACSFAFEPLRSRSPHRGANEPPTSAVLLGSIV